MKRSESSEDRFAQSWSEAMNGANITPPESVWAGIDRELANQEVVKLKKKAFYYKWAAVVAILLAVTVSIPGYLDFDNFDVANEIQSSRDSEKAIAEKAVVTQESNFEVENREPQVKSADNRPITSKVVIASDDDAEEKLISKENLKKSLVSTVDVPVITQNKEETQRSTERILLPTYKIGKAAAKPIQTGEVASILNNKHIDPLYMFEAVDFKKAKSKEDRALWAGVEVGSGTYNPNYQSNSSSMMATALLDPSSNSSPQAFAEGRADVPFMDENINAGVNYQVGMNVGMEVLKNITIESGFQYSIAQATTQTNILLDHQLMPQAVALTSEAASNPRVNEVVELQEVLEYREESIDLNNTFQFAAVPVRAGYIILDNKLNLRVNAGMVANLYLGNELSGKSEDVRSIQIKPGDNSPYRDISWLGTAGLSLGYQIQKRLNLVVEPNYTYALTPLTKSASNFDFSPTGLGVMAGLRFNLK